ncbi:sodium-independent sulfate anion transporter-like [Trichoplusia ni]|uniref:Sodium-independent sulfate anion transporter-like n=1 Tax=Trichoplusia ni TaxID=7111 RepID=A0A7E5V9F4_TRINI|nr:sodium-independent sulfate anion transporter-like [Trichoplusia ni]
MLRLRKLKISPKRIFMGLFPIIQWSKTYSSEKAIGDLIAGITIALTLIPQSIAYASLAGFEPQYGLYSSFMGPFIYAFMGTCAQVNLGPSALLSLLTFTYTNGTNADFAMLLAFFSGIVQLVAGTAQLGFLVEFISVPVVSGFTSAAALTIASSQIKGLLGLNFSADTFISTWRNFFLHVKEVRLNDTMLSLGCCIMLQGMKILKDVKIKTKGDDEKGHKKALVMQRALWFVGVARNATVVALATVTAYLAYEDTSNPFLLTGDITPGLPAVRPPPFQTTVGNTTYTAGEMISHLGTGLIVVPLVGILGNIAIAKAFAQGKPVDATQEIIALGVCNLVSSFFQSIPVNGSFSRSAVSNASGVKTPGSGIYTGILVILTLVLLTPFFYFIPRSALASVIVCAVLQMVDYEIVKKLWKHSKLDIITLLGTFLCCLFLGIEIGLLCGVGIDAVLLLYYHSRPPLDVQYIDNGSFPAHFAIHPVGGLHFAGAERVRSKLLSLQQPRAALTTTADGEAATHTPQATTTASTRILVVYCDALYRFDYTFLQGIKMLVLDWSKTGRVIWCDAKDTIKHQLTGVLPDPIFCEKSQLRAHMIPGESQSTA